MEDEIIFYDMENNEQSIKVSDLAKIVEEDFIVTKTYWLGTDLQGRDMLSRLMAGTIVSLSVGLISVIISLVIGITLGDIAGYYRGWVDDVIMWLINVVWSIPTLLLVIAITIALGKGFWQVFVAVGLTMWVEVARVVRGQVLSVLEKEFIEAGRSLGFRSGRIIFRHVLPNIMGPVIVMSAANFASAILIESGLSFLSVGVQPPMPSWGSMISEHQAFFTTEWAYMAVLPGIVTAILVLSFMLVGNGLRDALDTRMIDDVKG
jgi:peptide/nickel transport system permease protein